MIFRSQKEIVVKMLKNNRTQINSFALHSIQT